MKIYKKSDKEISPLSKITCACGCNIEFQPGRIDQVYLNYRHANFAYNHGERKKRYAEERETTKIIRNNDRIAEKYHSSSGRQKVIVNFTLLKAEGFDKNYYTRLISVNTAQKKIYYYALYNFCFRIITQNDLTYIEIQKL